MKALPLTLTACALALAGVGTAMAQDYSSPGFYGTLGYNDVAPKSNNGILAGAFHSSIGDDAEPALTLGYRFPQNWSVEAWFPIVKFQHDVKLEGMQSATVKHMPVLVTGQYHFLADQAWQPFVGLGYGWVSVSDERTTGPIAGTSLDVKDAA